MIQATFHTCPTVLREMSDDELVREFAKYKLYNKMKADSYKKLEKKNKK